MRLRDEFDELQARIDYRFRDRGLLEHALTHKSRAAEDASGGVADNESLEFLGDAVLGLVVADTLFRQYPGYNEGQKSKIKAAVVSTQSLARQAEAMRLGDHLILGRGEEKTGGRFKQALLADAYEALIAAIYLDGGLDAATTFLRRELKEAIDAGSAQTFAPDYKSALQERLQALGRPLPEYRVSGPRGPITARRSRSRSSSTGRCSARRPDGEEGSGAGSGSAGAGAPERQRRRRGDDRRAGLRRRSAKTGSRGWCARSTRRCPTIRCSGRCIRRTIWRARKQRLRDFLIGRFGGPPRYVEQRGHPRLRMRHMPFAIDRRGAQSVGDADGPGAGRGEAARRRDGAAAGVLHAMATFMINGGTSAGGFSWTCSPGPRPRPPQSISMMPQLLRSSGVASTPA